MAYGDWDKIIVEYQGIYAESPRTSEHASAMLELIPRIRDEPSLQGVVPGTTHATLFLRVPQERKEVHVWYENGIYTVDLYDLSLSTEGPQCYETENITAGLDEIVSILQSHIEKIRVRE